MFFSIIKDDKGYKLYYINWDENDVSKRYLAVAESKDGITWIKPDLKIFDHPELKGHNNVVIDPGESMFVFYDENPDCPKEEKYKVVSPYGIAPQRRKNVGFVVMKDKKTYTVGKYQVTAINAFHAPQLGSLNYIIEENQKSVLYLVDSGYPTEETLAFLRGRNRVFDCVIMDGTMGVAPPKTYMYHMGFEENKELKAQLLLEKIANENTRFIVTHITHNKAETHEKIEEIFKGSGIEVAYDGLEIEI